ncbi:hypothetical protein niasHT_013460 [Heterodera trifolii]|uniref:GDP-D-glucose phosphorylase 1 n=1 Tax=Heterodera trifolii TaxID=157864 RepID=A0ABD2LCP4_9BILA
MSSIPFLEYKRDDFVSSAVFVTTENHSNQETNDKIKHKLLFAWKCAQEKGVLNYKLSDSKSKQIDGNYAFSLMVNKERSRKRRSAEQFESLCQPFDEEKWNFTRLKEEECLFKMVRLDRCNAVGDFANELTTIAVNASPVNFGHSLVVPSPSKRLPQLITAAAICDGLELLSLVSDPNFVLIFNGLLAHASVNHLHLHSLFWPYKSGIVTKETEMVQNGLFSIIRRPTWFVPAFVFQLTANLDIESLARRIEKAAFFLTSNDFSYNLFFARAKKLKTEMTTAAMNHFTPTVYLFPRRKTYGGLDSNCDSFIPASLELAGLIPIYDDIFFESASEKQIIEVFDGYSLIKDKFFEELVAGMARHLQ